MGVPDPYPPMPRPNDRGRSHNPLKTHEKHGFPPAPPALALYLRHEAPKYHESHRGVPPPQKRPLHRDDAPFYEEESHDKHRGARLSDFEEYADERAHATFRTPTHSQIAPHRYRATSEAYETRYTEAEYRDYPTLRTPTTTPPRPRTQPPHHPRAPWTEVTGDLPGTPTPRHSRAKEHDPENEPISTPHLPPRWVNIPDTFAPDDTYYDTNSVLGSDMPRLIQATKWTRSKGLAGRDVQDVRLVEVLWDGMDNWGIRLLANGKYIAPELLRNFHESVFISTLVGKLRKKRTDGTYLNIEALAQRIAARDNIPQTTDKDKHTACIALATFVHKQLETLMPNHGDPDIAARLRTLEDENRRLRERPPASSQTVLPFVAARAEEGTPTRLPAPRSEPVAPPRTEPVAPDTVEAFRHSGSKARPFEHQAPTSHSTQAITILIKNLGLNPTQSTKLKNVTASLTAIIADMSEEEKVTLVNYTVEWGLPCTVATKLKESDAVRLIALANYLTG